MYASPGIPVDRGIPVDPALASGLGDGFDFSTLTNFLKEGVTAATNVYKTTMGVKQTQILASAGAMPMQYASGVPLQVPSLIGAPGYAPMTNLPQPYVGQPYLPQSGMSTTTMLMIGGVLLLGGLLFMKGKSGPSIVLAK